MLGQWDALASTQVEQALSFNHAPRTAPTLRRNAMKCLSCADTAKLLRTSLKEAFPGVKFSVRSKVYACGASIHVGWTAGPYPAQVEAISGLFAGACFDGMTDMKEYFKHTIDGEPASLEVDFVFVRAKYSPELIEAAILDIRSIFPDLPSFCASDYLKGLPLADHSGVDIYAVLTLWLNGKAQFGNLHPSAGMEPKHSPTASRISRS